MENNSRFQSVNSSDPVARAEQAIARMKEMNREIARLEAQVSASLITVFESAEGLCGQQQPGSGSTLEMILRGLLMDASMQLNVSDRALETRLNTALDIAKRFPKTGELLEQGLIGLRVATVIAQEGTDIQEPSDLEFYDAEISKVALHEGMTAWAVKKKAKQLATSLTIDSFEETQRDNLAYFQAEGLKQVEVCDGVVENRFVTSAVDAQILKTRFLKIAKLKKEEPSESRSLGELEIESLVEVLAGSLDEKFAGVKAEVGLLIPTENLFSDKRINAPVMLEGYGPIVFDETVKTIFENVSLWRKILVNDKTGLVDNVETYQPSARQKRYLKARDGRCRWTGCGAKIQKTDIDHTKPWSEGGETKIGNLAHLCRRHHMAKHHSGWKLKQKSEGVLEWTSPTGKTYVDHPDPFPIKKTRKLELTHSPPF